MKIVPIAVFSTAIAFSPVAGADDQTDIAAIEKTLIKAFVAKDVGTLMSYYATDVFLFDDGGPPRQIAGAAGIRKDFEETFGTYPVIRAQLDEMAIAGDGTIAYAHYIQRMVFRDKTGRETKVTVRLTDIFRKTSGRWLIVHEHASLPYNYRSGKTDLSSSM